VRVLSTASAPCASGSVAYYVSEIDGAGFLSNNPQVFGVLRVGAVQVPNRAFLAPMSGVTDLPFRRLAKRYGAGLVVSEMVACESAASGSEEARLRAEGEGLDIHVVQLAGREPAAFTEGVRIAEGAGADIVDINMGCPAKRVTKGDAGAALMREPGLALRIIEATLRSASVPVTLKMRLGWDHNSLNAAALAVRAERAGVQLITVHGRTRCQFYKGRADWLAIREVCESVEIPVVANGDLNRPEDASAMLTASGADAVMIGRGAYGQPWMVGQIGARLAGRAVPAAPLGIALRDHVTEHYEMILGHYGVEQGVRVARKHLGWYLDRLAPCGIARVRQAVLTEPEPSRVLRLIGEVFGETLEALAA
jgi:tRNA-dihydrouridine synthase B